MIFRLAKLADIPVIHALAHQIWPVTYRDILSPEQLQFMLEEMYSQEALRAQFLAEITFLIAEWEGLPIGFASYAALDDETVFKIYKLYLLSSHHGKGIGRSFLNFIMDDVRGRGGNLIELHVNRKNPALHFYQKEGFRVYKEVDIPYYDFFLNDYIMRTKI